MSKSAFLLLIMWVVLIKISSAQNTLSYAAGNKNNETVSSLKTDPVFNFNAFSCDYALEKITKEMAGGHLFGDVIAKKMFLLDKKYTSEEANSPGNPQTITVIQKPEIYNAVKHIDKALKKSVRKGELSAESATYTLNKVLDVALSILTLDTRSFETAISTAKSDSEKMDLFTKRVNLIY